MKILIVILIIFLIILTTKIFTLICTPNCSAKSIEDNEQEEFLRKYNKN